MNMYETMTNKDLLKIIIKEKPNENIVDSLIQEFPTLPELLVNSEEAELINIEGIGSARAKQLKVTAELAKRIYRKDFMNTKYKITSPQDAYNFLVNDMRYLKHEELWLLMLDTKNQVIGKEIISVGSLSSSIVHPREVYIKPIKCSSASIIIAHSHPSGDATPSQEDINITKRLSEVGKLIGIELIDHLIIGECNYTSFKEKGLV